MGKQFPGHLLLCPLKVFFLISHCPGQQAKRIPIAPALPGRFDDFPGRPKGAVSVGHIHICLFHRKCGGQNNIRIHGCVCHEPLMDNRKQIRAPQALQDTLLAADRGHRIAAVNIEAAYGPASPDSCKSRCNLIDIDPASRFLPEIRPGDQTAVHIWTCPRIAAA